jgi:hypothetical protein
MSLFDLKYLSVGTAGLESRNALSARMAVSRLGGGLDDFQHLVDIIDQQRQALEERGETIKSLQKDLNAMGQMLLEERTKAARYSKLFGIAEKQLQQIRRKKTFLPLSPQPVARSPDLIDPVKDFGLMRFPTEHTLPVSPTPLSRKPLFRSGTKRAETQKLVASQEVASIALVTEIEEVRKEMSEMKERLEKQETEGKDVKAEQEMWKGKEAELVAQLEEAERTMQSLRLSLSESECMRIALEEKCKVMDSAHSELLLSVEMFRKKNEAEMYKLKAELAASQHSLKALRHTFGLA